MSANDLPSAGAGRLWRTVREELWEVAWLAAAVGVLSVAGIGLAIVLAGA